jgi:hypothetical protein
MASVFVRLNRCRSPRTAAVRASNTPVATSTPAITNAAVDRLGALSALDSLAIVVGAGSVDGDSAPLGAGLGVPVPGVSVPGVGGDGAAGPGWVGSAGSVGSTGSTGPGSVGAVGPVGSTGRSTPGTFNVSTPAVMLFRVSLVGNRSGFAAASASSVTPNRCAIEMNVSPHCTR